MNKIIARHLYFIFFLFTFLFFTGCSDEDPLPPDDNLSLVEYEKKLSRTVEEIEVLIRAAGVDELAAFMNYDIEVYSITYKTKYLSEEIIASGLVAFPAYTGEIPLLSFQHGTITRHLDAPTSDLTLYGLLSSVSSAGYIFCIPDLLGFGSSTDILHPYYHYESTAEPIIDMLYAAKELSEILNYSCNGDVFLAGYSEGGYATMAGHKMMEVTAPNGLELIASAPASGGYDLKGMQEYFFSLDTYDQPHYIAYVAMSYRQVYGYNNILEDIFKEPYATEIPALFDGSKSGSEINGNLTNVISDLVQDDILIGMDEDPKYNYLIEAFSMNSVHDFVPAIRMIMYHGTADVTVPYQNSVDTYDLKIQMGASPQILSFVPLEGATHSNGIFPYISHVLETFDGLK